MKTLVILPTYNEVESLQETLNQTLEWNPSVDVLVVDDASPDGTGQLADQLAKASSRISVLHRAKKEGLGPAYLAGFRTGLESNYDFIVEMDADGSHRPEDLQKLLAQAGPGTLVIGSRWIAGGEVANWSRFRVAVSSLGNRYAAWMLRSKIRDMTAGFRVYARDLLSELIDEKVSSHGYSFQVELAARSEKLGRVIEVPIVFVEREHGKSKMSFRIVVEALRLITRWGIALRLRR